MWVDWVKVWDLKDIVVPDYTCKANPDRSESDLCGAANVSFHSNVWQIAFSRTCINNFSGLVTIRILLIWEKYAMKLGPAAATGESSSISLILYQSIK